MKTGILLPKSNYQPLLQYDFLAGCKASLAHVGTDVEYVTANIGFGTDKDAVYAAAEKMLMEDDVDVLVMYADQQSLLPVAEFARAANKLIILVHPGARYMHGWEPHPNVISHTLQHNLCCQQTAARAAGIATKAAFCTSFFEAGFPVSHALSHYYISNGGMLEYNFISRFKAAEFTVAPLVAFLQQRPDVTTLLTLFNGELGHLFLQQLAAAQLDNLQLFAGPMLFEDALVANYGPIQLSCSLEGYIPWHPAVDLPANKLFMEQMSQTLERAITSFTMHGWTTGQLLAAIASGKAAHGYKPKGVLQALEQVQIDSPRGPITFDPATQHTLAPLWYAHADANMHVTIGHEMTATLDQWTALQSEVKGAFISNWNNTYPCG
ncbi:ABC transporter substrate-binding protein [Chitinophaga sp. Cy-1792]|uniref:ABC transporter substrate-binding protein n=1 Tax=Chitinophaga sp. Cy-1792 TaxID=2608339 RepID=UPI00141DA3ED|nr:ABC transporter substrate-binding protein [Chitinophaga sp. Cy-1792]NIG54507.1 ABC transporter substrate-binding protein [Chitinophaga sp. Cy-1792]